MDNPLGKNSPLENISPAAQLLRELIRCPSVTPKSAGVLDVLEAFLTPLGFSCTQLRFDGDGSYPVDNLFATRGDGGQHLLFVGHTDVVPTGPIEDWQHDPFAAIIAHGEMFGRGAVDMKSGVACFCAALAEMVADGSADAGKISLIITNDEEADAVNGTVKVLDWAAAQGHSFDFSLVGEPSSVDAIGDGIKIGRRGSLSGKINVSGVQGHVAYPERANNPMPVMADLAQALATEPLDQGTERFQPSNLEITGIDTGNEATNIIPAQATLRFNVRFNETWDGDKLDAWIAQRIASIPHHGCTINYQRHSTLSRCFVSPQSEAVDLLVEAIVAETGRRPDLSTGGGTSDARFVSKFCPAIECGLVGATMHKVNERVPLAELDILVDIYLRFTRAFLSSRKQS